MTQNLNKATLTMVASAVFCVACESSVDATNPQAKNEVNQVASPVETISIKELEEQISPLKERIQQLENELESSQELAVSKATKAETKQFDQSLSEQTIKTLQEENQALISQLAMKAEGADLEKQVSLQQERIQELEEALANSQEIVSGNATQSEDAVFDKNLLEQKIEALQEQNQELTSQLAAQDAVVKQLQDDIATMDRLHQEELTTRTTAQ